jgi:hypothetical protein
VLCQQQKNHALLENELLQSDVGHFDEPEHQRVMKLMRAVIKERQKETQKSEAN